MQEDSYQEVFSARYVLLISFSAPARETPALHAQGLLCVIGDWCGRARQRVAALVGAAHFKSRLVRGGLAVGSEDARLLALLQDAAVRRLL